MSYNEGDHTEIRVNPLLDEPVEVHVENLHVMDGGEFYLHKATIWIEEAGWGDYRSITFDLVDGNRTLTIQGDPTLDDWFDQSVKTTASPTFASGVSIGNLSLGDGAITDSSGAIGFGNENLSTTGTLECGALTIADGSDLNIQEAIIYGGATTENKLTVPDNLANALDVNEGGNSYLILDTTDGAEQLEYFTNQYVVTKAGTDEGLEAALDSGAKGVFLTAGGTFDGAATVDNAGTTISSIGWGALLDLSGGQGFHAINLNNKNNVTLRDLAFLGNSGGGGTGRFLIDNNQAATYWSVDHCLFENGDDRALYIQNANSQYGAVTSCAFIGGDQYAMDLRCSNIITFGNKFNANYGGVYHAANSVVSFGSIYWQNAGYDFHNKSAQGFALFGNIFGYNSSYSVRDEGGYGAIFGNYFVRAGTNACSLEAGYGVATANVLRNTANNCADYYVASGYNAICNSMCQSGGSYAEQAVRLTAAGDNNIVMGIVSFGHPTCGVQLDAGAAGNIIFANNLKDTTRITDNSGVHTNIIWDFDTANLIINANSALELSAADGARDNLDVLRVINDESTAGQSKGIYVEAGSNDSDYCQKWTDYAGNLLMELDGAGRLGVGAEAPSNALALVQDTAISTTENFYTARFEGTKTAGATDASDNYYGLYSHARFNHNGSTMGSWYASYNYAQHTDGTLTALTSGYDYVLVDGGTVESPRGNQCFVDLNSGNVTGWTYGTYARVDVEAAMTSAGTNIVGHYLWMDVDKAPSGTVYMLYLEEMSGIDYGIYQNGSAANYLGGNLGIGQVPAGNGPLYLNMATEDVEFVDAGSAGATEQDWIEVNVGGNQGYIRVYAAK
jgi:hypothetical protein